MAMWYYRPLFNCHRTTRQLNRTGLYGRGYQGMKQPCAVAIQWRGDIPHRTTLSVHLYHGCNSITKIMRKVDRIAHISLTKSKLSPFVFTEKNSPSLSQLGYGHF